MDAYVIHRLPLDLVPKVEADDAQFYLKHADDKDDHIMVDNDFNITAIIDWEWAHTAPAIAFNSPIGFLPVADFYDGQNSIGEDETTFAQILEDNGREDLVRFVRSGRLLHRFAFCCGFDLENWQGFLCLFRGLRDGMSVDDGLDWDDWKEVALLRYKHDNGLQALLKREAEASAL